MKIIKINILFTAICLFALGAMFVATPASAITVSPVRIEVSGNPGQTIQGNLILLNELNTPQKMYSSFANFEARGTTGTPYFTPATQGLGIWITVPSEVNLQPGEQKDIPYSIAIPSTAPAGGNYAAIFWSTTPPAGDNQVAMSSRTGILVLLTVNGNINVSGALSGFKVNAGILSSLPVKFQYSFGNSGNDRIDPEGNITIKNLGLWTSATVNANQTQGNVLPNSVRVFDPVWGNDQAKTGFFGMVGREWKDFHFGIYTAKLSLDYGKDKTATANTSFFVFPWQLLLVVIIVLLIVACLVVMVVKKWDIWIIKQARK